MTAYQRFTQLSAPRQALVRLFQSVNFGHILGVVVQYGEPVFNPAPTVLLDLKLDADESPRRELDLLDFALRDEVRRLMAFLDELKSGRIERVEIRSGVPRRIVIERRLTEVPPC
jgi:hypothetical protein